MHMTKNTAVLLNFTDAAMSRQNCLLILLLLVPFAASAILAATPKKKANRNNYEDEKPSIYFVSVHGEPSAAAFRQLGADRNETWLREQKKTSVRFHDQLLRRAMDGVASPCCPSKLYSFHHAVNGFAVHATASLAERLRAAPEVAAVEEDVGTRLMTTRTPRLLGLPGGVWKRRRDGEADDGEGVVVGIVDSGVDPAHPSFAYAPRRGAWPFPGKACGVGPIFPPGSCNGKIVVARYFAAGAAAVLPLNASHDLSPFDAEGHGSHVAAIAAGNRGVPVVVNGALYGFASGMAPSARLAVYKAVYPAGGTMVDLIAAIDQAIEDKVDVLVLSVGSDARPGTKVTFLSMLDIALLSARRAGVFVAQAAGNRGPAESSVISYSPWVMTVAAGTTGRSYTSSLVLGDGRRILGLGLSAPTLRYRLIAAKDAAPPDMERAEECQDAEALRPRAELLQGSIVLCSFSQGFVHGSSAVTAILDVAEALGFAGFVLVADVRYGDFVAQPLPFRVPGLMVPRVADALVIWSYYAEHTVYAGRATVFGATAAITEGRLATFKDAAPVVTRYSSRGPDVADNESTPADVLKPDILAPGDQIWSAWSALSANEPILAGNHFAMISGTSMAAPHVAGVAALIKQRHPAWGPSAIASALSTTARRHDDRGGSIMSEGSEIGSLHPGTPFDYGAGFIDPADALDPGLIISPEDDDYFAFLCSLPQLSPEDVRAATGAACQAPLASPADLNLPSITVSELRGSLSIRRRVMNVASNTETYLCSSLPPAGVDVTVRPGWFEVASGGTQEVVIELRATRASGVVFGFGEIVLTGSLDHLVRLPLAVRPLAMTPQM